MNHLKKLALAATIALAGITSVQAQQIAGNATPVTMLNTYGGLNQWTFSDAGLQLLDFSTGNFDGAAPTRTAGSSFIDVFFVNVPDNEYVSFDFGPAFGTRPGVSFTEFAVGYAYGTGPTVDDVGYGAHTYSVSTDTYNLGSGTYEFDIFGTYLTAGGGFEGDVFGTPVPEPGNWALLLAGLGAVGVLSRRRSNKA